MTAENYFLERVMLIPPLSSLVAAADGSQGRSRKEGTGSLFLQPKGLGDFFVFIRGSIFGLSRSVGNKIDPIIPG